jgi:hypothetical protein
MLRACRPTLTVVSRYKTPNQFLHMLESIISPARWKHRVSLVIPIKVDETLNGAVHNNFVNFLPGFNPVAVPHVFNPRHLKISNCVWKFVPEGLDFDFAE